MGIERTETKRKGTWSAEKIIADWSAAFIAANGKSPAQPLSYERGWFVFRNTLGNVTNRYRRFEIEAMTHRLKFATPKEDTPNV